MNDDSQIDDTGMPGSTDSATAEIASMMDQLNAADSTLARIQEDLKDATRRQEVGSRLVKMLATADAGGLMYQKIKIATRAGTLKVAFEFPMVVFQDLVTKADSQ